PSHQERSKWRLLWPAATGSRECAALSREGSPQAASHKCQTPSAQHWSCPPGGRRPSRRDPRKAGRRSSRRKNIHERAVVRRARERVYLPHAADEDHVFGPQLKIRKSLLTVIRDRRNDDQPQVENGLNR